MFDEADKLKYKQFRPPVLQLNDDAPERPGSSGPLPSPRAALISGLRTATDRRQQQMQQQQQQQNYTMGPQGQRIWSPFQEYPGIQRVGSPSKTGIAYSGSGYNSPIRAGSPRSPMIDSAVLTDSAAYQDGRTSPSPQSMYAALQAKQRELQVTSLLISQQQERIQLALNEAIQEGHGQSGQPSQSSASGPPGQWQPDQPHSKFTPTTLPAHHSQHQWLHEQLLASPLDDNNYGGYNAPSYGPSLGGYAAGYGLGPGRSSSPSPRIQRPSSSISLRDSASNSLAHPTPVVAQPQHYNAYSHSHSHSNSSSSNSYGVSHGGGSLAPGSPVPPSTSTPPPQETPFRRGHRKASSLSTNVFTSPNKDGRQPVSREGDLMFPVRQPQGPPPVDELKTGDVNFDTAKVNEILG